MLGVIAIVALIGGTSLAAYDTVAYSEPVGIVETIGERECVDLDGDGWVNPSCECVGNADPNGHVFW